MADDWGNTASALDYGYVEDAEVEAAERIRNKVEEAIGSFKTCIDAGRRFRTLVDENKNPSDYLDPSTESRGKFTYNLNTALRIPIQWVTGDYKTAEQSFININTGAVLLSDQEANYLKNRAPTNCKSNDWYCCEWYKIFPLVKI